MTEPEGLGEGARVHETQFDVVVIGAGPVGLALAIELGMRGVRVLVAERNSRSGLAPRAKTTNARTRAHLRRWGIADTLAAASPLGIDYPNDIHFVTSLSGFPLAVFRNAFNAAPDRADAYPEHAQWVPQYALEKVLLDHVQTLPDVTVRFETTFVDGEQSGETVTTRLRDNTGEVSAISSRYLVGADGARSAVRDLIGAKMEGTFGISHHSNVVFHAPGLAEAQVHGAGVMFLQIGGAGISITGPMDKGDIWYFGTNIRGGEPLTGEEVIAQIKATTGIDLPYKILSADKWVASTLLADKYREGRIILAGDACHLHPPFGGYGMNMGVGDAVDLGWKIAAELQGWGGADLIAAYEAERRPVHRIVIEEALANHQMMLGSPWRDGMADDTPEGEAIRKEVGAAIQAAKVREYHTLGTVLGLGYEGSPIIDSEPEPAPQHDGQHYTPSARPGSLAPHGWLEDGRSLYDAFGQGFALVVADGADEAQVSMAVSEARALRAPFEIVRPGQAITDLYKADLTLVRPDQHVAWRGSRWNGALTRALARRPAVSTQSESGGSISLEKTAHGVE